MFLSLSISFTFYLQSLLFSPSLPPLPPTPLPPSPSPSPLIVPLSHISFLLFLVYNSLIWFVAYVYTVYITSVVVLCVCACVDDVASRIVFRILITQFWRASLTSVFPNDVNLISVMHCICKQSLLLLFECMTLQGTICGFTENSSSNTCSSFCVVLNR